MAGQTVAPTGVLTTQLFHKGGEAARARIRRARVLAVFSFRYDAHLVSDLIENLRPIVDGYVAYDDRGADAPYSDERVRRVALLAAAHDMAAQWVLCVDPDERLEDSNCESHADHDEGG